MAPKATVAVLANSAMAAEVSGEKPRPISMAAHTATGVPKPAAPSKKAPKQKGIRQDLQPPVGGDPAQRMLEDPEQAFFHRQAVEEDHVQDDPADGPEAVDRAQGGGLGRHVRRHGEDIDRDQEGQDQRDQPPPNRS